MQKLRSAAAVLTTIAAAGAVIPAAAGAMPTNPGRPAATHNGPARHGSVYAKEHVNSAGTYDVRVVVANHSEATDRVALRIGGTYRSIDVRGDHKVTIKDRIAVHHHKLNVSAHARTTPKLTITWREVRRPSRHHHSAPAAPPAPIVPKAPTGTTGTSGSTGSTGTTGTTASGPVGSAGTTGSTSPTTTGTPTISLPSGYKPVMQYTNLVKNYDFTQGSLPADWEAINGTNNGYAATEYMSSQVSFSSAGTSLTAAQVTSPTGLPYESGWIDTAGKYLPTHGLIDFRAKMPAGQGLWSGLWLLGPESAAKPEIDVQEMLLGNTTTAYGSLHDWNQDSPVWGETQSGSVPDASAGYNDYQVVWQPGMITWAVNGVAYAQYTSAQAAAAGQAWPFDSTGAYLIANLAVGSASSWGGAPTSSTSIPATVQLQSVKVWQ